MLWGVKVADILQRNSRGWPLYCVAWSYRYRNVFTGKVKEDLGFEYLHAEHDRYARAEFYKANAQKAECGKLEIISVAPAIGWHALDDNGDEAIA